MNGVREEGHKEICTVDDIYALPDGKRAELIDGKIYDMAPPSGTHQKLLHFFDRTIGNYIQSKEGICEIYPAPFAVFLNKDDINYVEPDISVICDPSKLDEVTVYRFEKETMEEYPFGEEVPVGIYEDFSNTL